MYPAESPELGEGGSEAQSSIGVVSGQEADWDGARNRSDGVTDPLPSDRDAVRYSPRQIKSQEWEQARFAQSMLQTLFGCFRPVRGDIDMMWRESFPG